MATTNCHASPGVQLLLQLKEKNSKSFSYASKRSVKVPVAVLALDPILSTRNV